ncbi:sialidase family protein [soil metagenome]
MRMSITVLSLVISATSLLAAEPPRLLVFEAGTGGYSIYRIPGVVVTKAGSVLAYCEARKSNGDWAAIDLLMKRSTDGGKTWSEPTPLHHDGSALPRSPVVTARKLGKDTERTWNNPVMIADAESGAVHLLYCVDYYRCFSRRSDDDGKSWTAPVEITDTFAKFRPAYDWKVIATGPGHGIRLKNGRLLVAVWLSTATGGNAHHPSVTATIYSDDHGKTWQTGDICGPNVEPLIDANESMVAELADGRVMVNMRTIAKENRRSVAISPDGSTKWSTPKFDDTLVDPICMASLIRLPGQQTLAFSNPNNLESAKGTPKPGQSRDRRNLTIRLSDDDGKTWPHAKVLEPGPSGYSDLGTLNDGTIVCLFEKGKTANNGSLYLATFTTEWVKAK